MRIVGPYWELNSCVGRRPVRVRLLSEFDRSGSCDMLDGSDLDDASIIRMAERTAAGKSLHERLLVKLGRTAKDYPPI